MPVVTRRFKMAHYRFPRSVCNAARPRDYTGASQPYNQAVITGANVFVSGIMGTNPETGNLVDGGIVAETEQAIQNLQIILKNSGNTPLENIMKTNIMLANIKDIDAVSEIYKKYLTLGHGSSIFQAVLPQNARIQIEATALSGMVKLVDEFKG